MTDGNGQKVLFSGDNDLDDQTQLYFLKRNILSTQDLLKSLTQKKKKCKNKLWALNKRKEMKMHKYLLMLLLTAFFCATNNLQAKFTVLVFAPHPDDDILGCGGSLIHHVKKGHRVIIVYMTSQALSQKTDLGSTREIEAKNAAEKIGVKELIFLRQDNGLIENDETIKKIADLIVEYKPKIVYTPHKLDNHRDHIATHLIVVEAAKKARKICKIEKILGYEIWNPIAEVTYKESIADVIDLKIEAFLEHKSQLAYRNYKDGIKALNRYRGLIERTGGYTEYAEAFSVTTID